MNKSISIRVVAVAWILAIALILSVAAQPISAQQAEGRFKAVQVKEEDKKVKRMTYEECVAKYSKVTDYVKLQKVIAKLSDKRIEKLNDAKDKVNDRTDAQLAAEYKTKLTALIDADIKKIETTAANAEKTDSASALVKNMCDIYTTSVYSRAKAQYAVALGAILNIDSRVNEALNHQANKKLEDSPLKAEAEARLKEARSLIAANEAFAKPAMKAVLAAKSTEQLEAAFSKDLRKQMIANIKTAVRLHTEAWAVRGVARQLNPTAKAEVVGDVQLIGDNGKPIPDDSAGRGANKAVVKVKTGGKTYDLEVIRGGKDLVWRYSKPDDSADNETKEDEKSNIEKNKIEFEGEQS